ncbi:MAG: ATP-binding protein [Myxococcota bacterium]|nr:ATP-binding protein [Myxococcota bacterium]
MHRLIPPQPFVPGRAISGHRAFFGRQDMLRRIESELHMPGQNLLVLVGERLVGKTSLLLQLGRTLPATDFLPIYYDLAVCGQQSAHHAVASMLRALWEAAELPPPLPQDAEAEDELAWQHVLAEVYQRLGQARRPVLLLDHLDQLDAVDAPLGAGLPLRATLVPLLRRLVERELRLAFVFAVGADLETLSPDSKSLLKGGRIHRIGLLDEGSARALVQSARQEGVLVFKDEAIERVLGLTAGHPYFIQLLGQLLCEEAYAGQAHIIQKVEVAAVEHAARRALEVAEGACSWIWAAFGPGERAVLTAVAHNSDEHSGVSASALGESLQRRGVRIPESELESMLAALTRRQVLCERGGGYACSVELFRRWVVERRPPVAILEELNPSIPLAERLYRLSQDLAQSGDHEGAMVLLRQSLRQDPTHLAARLLLGSLLLAAGQAGEAVDVLEEAYQREPVEARELLLRALRLWAEDRDQAGDDVQALAACRRALELAPDDPEARARSRAIWLKRGEEALRAEDLDRALAAFREAGDEERVAAVQQRQRRRALERIASEAQQHLWQEQWQQAIQCYERLVADDPQEPRWKEALARARLEYDVNRLYAEGSDALARGDRAAALRALAGVVYLRPEHKDAASLLAHAAGPPPGPMPPVPRTAARSRGRRLSGLLLGVGLTLLLGAGVGAVAARRLYTTTRPVPAPIAVPEDPEAVAARVLLEADVALAGRRWDEARRRAAHALEVAPHSAIVRRVAEAIQARAAREQQAESAYAAFLQAANQGDPAAALDRYRAIPDGSIYRELAQPTRATVLRAFAADWVARAEKDRARTLCSEVQDWIGQVLAHDPAHADAHEALINTCREVTGRRSGAAGLEDAQRNSTRLDKSGRFGKTGRADRTERLEQEERTEGRSHPR